ncbi:LysR family transcriptional regulator [Rhodococcus sp. HNM0569]|uniref:LysR family transcriptional regulator n=1 Tax=Rhodococcus sp. HNM0569 TaxID=2716340 RepID=UPI00146D2417|nr:LysR family transcriptional regulator [Rhodococcus sp. HNM0569]NLU84425.1 LysR family transcriptional regulator [Rhodococcus sp. HNM0569]
MDELMARLAPHLSALNALAVQDGHMTRAAQALGIPQSSMSRRIHLLERELGTPLLVPRGRTVTLTPAAERLARRVRGPLREMADALDDLAGEADADHGTVRFGFPLTMGSGRVPALLAAFHREVPGVHLHLEQAHGSDLASRLREGEVDVAVVIPPPEGIEHVIVDVQTITAVLPSGHSLAHQPRLGLADLRHDPFVANPSTYNLRRSTDSWCRAAGFTPDITIEVTEFATMRELVGRGLGVALLPHADRTASGTVEIPLEPDTCRRDVALAWGPTGRTPVAQRLRRYMLEHWRMPVGS